jgi:hypothetical protein
MAFCKTGSERKGSVAAKLSADVCSTSIWILVALFSITCNFPSK